MEENTEPSKFDVMDFDLFDSFDPAKPSTDGHLFPFEIKKGNKFYEVIITHKYEIMQDDKRVVYIETDGNVKTNCPISLDAVPVPLIVDCVNITILVTAQELERLSTERRGIAIRFHPLTKEYLTQKVIELLAQRN